MNLEFSVDKQVAIAFLYCKSPFSSLDLLIVDRYSIVKAILRMVVISAKRPLLIIYAMMHDRRLRRDHCKGKATVLKIFQDFR